MVVALRTSYCTLYYHTVCNSNIISTSRERKGEEEGAVVYLSHYLVVPTYGRYPPFVICFTRPSCSCIRTDINSNSNTNGNGN
mmetsp:Transcript_38397/g.41636  ORF Transcript_38397/g.41636 Transcript_38397/m.41636 type:complete len:83 (+) Transcript_38397:247-495(+)